MCATLDHPNLAPGWGCCHCRTYNGEQRKICKHCLKVRCPDPKTLN